MIVAEWMVWAGYIAAVLLMYWVGVYFVSFWAGFWVNKQVRRGTRKRNGCTYICHASEWVTWWNILEWESREVPLSHVRVWASVHMLLWPICGVFYGLVYGVKYSAVVPICYLWACVCARQRVTEKRCDTYTSTRRKSAEPMKPSKEWGKHYPDALAALEKELAERMFGE